MKIAIITECALSRKHGTGAQLLRIVNDTSVRFFHFYLTLAWGGQSEVPRSFRIEDPRFPYRGRRHVGRIERLLGLNWWDGYQLNTARFAKLRRKHDLDCDVAYVLVGSEDQAARANELLAQLQVPYVVHIMDIYDDNGFEPAAMPALARLFRGAAANIALSEPIGKEISKFGVDNIALIPIGQDPTSYVARPPTEDGPINVVTVGKPYPTGTSLLAEAWPSLKQANQRIRIIYAGQHSHSIPANLRADLDDRGYISDKTTYESLLAESHIAFLSGPSEMDRFGKFSIPSRTSDFLMAGLPIVAAVPQGTATQQFLQPLVPQAAAIAMDVPGIVAGITSFAADRQRWLSASETARRFGVGNVSMEQVRGKVLQLLESASKSQRMNR